MIVLSYLPLIKLKVETKQATLFQSKTNDSCSLRLTPGEGGGGGGGGSYLGCEAYRDVPTYRFLSRKIFYRVEILNLGNM